MDILHEVKFKILAFLSAVLVLLSFLVSPIHFSAPKVLAEELSPLEELQASEGFDEASLSTKTDITVIDFIEYWADKAELPLYFVYVYNPTDKVLKDSTDNRIHIQTNNSGHWNSYKLSYVKATEDGKYVKYVVSEPELLYNTHTDNTKRYYDVSEVKLMCDNNTTPSTFTVGFRYLFVFGNSGLEVTKEEYDVIRVDTIIPMVYRNIEEKVYDYPKGQINSVAFALPNDILEQYGEVSEIHFEYWRYRTSPIVVSDTRDNVNLHANRYKWVGITSDKLNGYYPQLGWGSKTNGGTATVPKVYYDYTYNISGNFTPSGRMGSYDKLTYSFCSEDTRAVDYDVSSDDLSNWVYSYADTYLPGQEYDSIPVKDGRLPAELFEDPYNEKYGYKDVYVKAETLEYKEQVSPNWWEQFIGTNSTYNDTFDTIQKVSYGDYNSLSKSVYCDFYKINETYYEKLGTLSQSAGRTGKTAYIFHFDLSDYYTAPCYLNNVGAVAASDGTHAYVAQTDVFLNFTFIDFTFCKNGVATVLAVSSDVIDIFPPIQHPEVPEPFDWWALLVKIIAIIVGIIVLVVVLKIVISLFKLIFGGKDKDKPKKKNSKKSNRRRKK
ncbi:MAG: hypothetical protein J6C23_09295 [Clostridia bacterium]|nr:hypothetical protein [Clostridia bacterium]